MDGFSFGRLSSSHTVQQEESCLAASTLTVEDEVLVFFTVKPTVSLLLQTQI